MRRVLEWVGYLAAEIVVFVLSTLFIGALTGMCGTLAMLGAVIAILTGCAAVWCYFKVTARS